jgi:hypothetical protein
MPSQRPSAAFDPIPPDLDLPQLVEETPNFEYVTRISCDMIEEQGIESFDKLVLLHVILGGKPLVIEGYNYRLDEWTFTCQWLQDNCGKKFEQARNLHKKQNMALSIGHYLNNMSKLTDQWTPENYKEPDRQRIYLKDIDCPQMWHDKLKEQIPQSVFYLNESTGDIGGPGSVEGLPGSANTKGQGVARAGDLMSCLPPTMRAENMMCYIGHEGTYTPAHREMCASLGQNLMVETSGVWDEFGKPTKPGSSIWFMTETSDRHTVSEYWLSTLGHDIEVENHFAQINAWKAAPFKTYIVDQRAGDFILIPPLAPHQVWNRGTRTMKAAWNRTTVETLEMALHEALPRARMVCRDEQYKNKAIVYFALEKYSGLLTDVESQKQSAGSELQVELEYSPKIRQLQKDFRRLFSLYTEILLSEMLGPVSTSERKGQYIPYDSFVTCSYCRCNIFNRFLTCTSCIEALENGDENTYDICMDCFAMGRSCSCISKYKWVEQHHWKDLTQKHEFWKSQIIASDGGLNEKSPTSLDVAHKNLGRKTLAQVCQEQLKVRPYQDPKKPLPAITTRERRRPGGMQDVDSDDDEEVSVAVDAEGRAKRSKSKKTRADRLPKSWAIEHVSCYPLQQWKLAACTKCDRKYSYGSLYRMFDLMPQSVMENLEWECPACLKICSCGACRRKQGTKPYEPVGTVLGHDTKKVADPRSVESLVNFSLPNTNWIKVAGDDNSYESRRLSRRKDEAEKAKAKDPALDDNYVDEQVFGTHDSPYTSNGIMYTSEPEMPIDPMLTTDQPSGLIYGRPSRRDADSEYTDSPPHTPPGIPNFSKRVMYRDLTPPSYGIRSRHEPNKAPLANMVPQENQPFTSNGISYEYPDPTMSQSTRPRQFLHSEQPQRKRSTANIIQSDLHEPSRTTSIVQLTQLEQMLEDAGKNDRYISTEAAITGKMLRIKLCVSSSKLATVTGTMPNLTGPSNGIQQADRPPPLLLQSDYPTASPVEQHNTSKRRRIRKEDDGDFTTHKRPDRRISMSKPNLVARKSTRRPSTKYTEISSDSEASTQIEASPFVPVNRPQVSRPLPKYLAQRHRGEEPTSLAKVPKNLAFTPRDKPQSEVPPTEGRRATKVPKASTALTNGDTTPQKDPPISQQVHTPGAHSSPSTMEVREANAPLDPALRRIEDNRKAKLRALHWADEDDDNDFSPDTDAPKHRVPAKKFKPNGKLLATPKSVFSRPGVNERKVKIISAKSASIDRKTASKAVEIARRSLGL